MGPPVDSVYGSLTMGVILKKSGLTMVYGRYSRTIYYQYGGFWFMVDISRTDVTMGVS